MLGEGTVHAEDCLDRFPEGTLRHPALAPGRGFRAAGGRGFAPLYLTKQPMRVTDAATCDYVYTGDVFRLVETRAALALLLAGCMGDFEGGGRVAFSRC